MPAFVFALQRASVGSPTFRRSESSPRGATRRRHWSRDGIGIRHDSICDPTRAAIRLLRSTAWLQRSRPADAVFRRHGRHTGVCCGGGCGHRRPSEDAAAARCCSCPLGDRDHRRSAYRVAAAPGCIRIRPGSMAGGTQPRLAARFGGRTGRDRHRHLGRRRWSTPSTCSTTWTERPARWPSSPRLACAPRARDRRRVGRGGQRRPVRRVPGISSPQPELAGQDLPGRRGKHAARALRWPCLSPTRRGAPRRPRLALLVGFLLVGVPALDTTLVIVSRSRRGVSVLTAGRDHLTHRTRLRIEAPGGWPGSGRRAGVGQRVRDPRQPGRSAALVYIVLAFAVLAVAAIVALEDAIPGRTRLRRLSRERRPKGGSAGSESAQQRVPAVVLA